MHHIIKTALVGYGMSGRVFHAPFLHALTDFDLDTVVERHSEESRKKYPYVNIVKSIDEVLADPGIELVVITTPNTSHAELGRKVLQAKKNLLIDKPFTITSQEAQELFELAKQNRVTAFAYQNRRYDGDFLTVQEILRNEYLGPIHYFESHFDRYTYNKKKQGWRRENLPGSGVLYDLGAHLIDQAIVLFGKPDSVFAQVLVEKDDSRVDDAFALELSYPGLRVRLCASSMTKIPGPRFVIHGRNGSFVKHGLDVQEEALKNGEVPCTKGWGEESPDMYGKLDAESEQIEHKGQWKSKSGDYAQFYRALAETLRGERESPVRPEEIELQLRIIEGAFESSKTGRTVEV